ncbi:hypothetical protein CVU76_03660 [Candidatus Dojkabacteria bacterium HGW-Dojkabacteria-1]|uniref:Uncharacterized protein n=1 Tax=Candidatus Dojkabacteria bacterium HGW-Dojkabacteria-1 TaxID=2013761 RepID=A0A2N2F4I1_9BACT|nr:MAG: hypothetical protein CVU76_03660 [Candidatus Dojkabacteria bacterium HGW-Dojkabacteria-1]
MNQDLLSRFSPIIVNIKPSKKAKVIRYFEYNDKIPIIISEGDMLFELQEAILQSSREGLIPLIILEQYLGKHYCVGTDIFMKALDSSEVKRGIVLPDGNGCIDGQREILESIVEGSDWCVGCGAHPNDIEEVCSEYLIETNLEYKLIR